MTCHWQEPGTGCFKRIQNILAQLFINDLLDIEKLSAGKLSFELQAQPLENYQTYSIEQQVLTNLLSNAIKFSPKGGRVSISVQTQDEQVRVTITDQGAGVPEGFRKRIFEKFSQADASDTRKIGGTGLGLAISRELIERMGGCMGFDSVEGQGSSFWFALPLINS